MKKVFRWKKFVFLVFMIFLVIYLLYPNKDVIRIVDNKSYDTLLFISTRGEDIFVLSLVEQDDFIKDKIAIKDREFITLETTSSRNEYFLPNILMEDVSERRKADSLSFFISPIGNNIITLDNDDIYLNKFVKRETAISLFIDKVSPATYISRNLYSRIVKSFE